MNSRLLYGLIVGAVILAALLLRLWDPVPVARLRSLAFDTYQQLRPAKFQPQLPVRIVDIDEESLRRLGQWPWPRTLLAELTEQLTEMGAAAIGFDIVFPEEDRMSPANILKSWPDRDEAERLESTLGALPSNDAVFAEAIGQAPVTLGFIGLDAGGGQPVSKAGFAFGGDDPKLFAPHFKGAAASLPILQDAAKGSGSLNWVPEYDHVIRRMPMLATVGDRLYPAFAGELLRIAQGASTYVVKSSGASGEEAFGEKTGIAKIRVGDFEVPTDARGEMWMKFSPANRDRYIPAWALLQGEIGAEAIEGRIILIGTSAAGLLDLRATPLDAAIPGVELHAQAVEQILTGDFLLRPDFAKPAELIYILALGILIAVLIYRAGALLSAGIGIAAIAAVIGFSWYAYESLGWLVDPVYPAIALVATYLAGTLFVFLRTEHERNRVRNAFSHYMAPALVERLAADPSRLKLGGETRDMTLLFSDVRGFTTISEGLDAEELTRLLNELFTPLSEIILEENGIIDKYMGDAVMAFWNAPLDDADHAANAARAALRIAGGMDALNAKWRAAADAKGRPFHPVVIGIGLNTGPCCVGNLGSETRFDYSVIGDNVNIASRLEGQCKTYGVDSVVGESTAELAPDFAYLELDLLKVKGKTEAVRIFTLRGDGAAKADPDFQAHAARHADLLQKYRAKDWDGAEKLCDALAETHPDLAALYGLYKDRIAVFRKSPPPKNWDGTSEAEGK
ncbi:adenylate/guanylate cyclase domain-containing protein [Methyloligella sp. 2.7D]|uniref:CHASE2 domain-containing protein n=1 Tax=unclassified Methyloligella TaxID=2625955 RepID=UPI00157DAF3A|nr:adenylate/guanylate cyclase domain-containing protein [Methyloligella sp. GL2]QKP77322.1 adenylate/guanylate cyclase domain-containing protein [Methyloligella sp. GL2]